MPTVNANGLEFAYLEVPVLYLHGRNDGCLGVDLTTTAATFLSPESASKSSKTAATSSRSSDPTR